MAIRTRITEKFDLEWPIVSAPMAIAAGGKLAAEVTQGGGLGMIGGGYGDAEFIGQAWSDAGNHRAGIGFITWSLEKQPELLDAALEKSPAAIMLSFGNPGRFSNQIKDAGIALICQCQTMAHVDEALDAGADVIVAQGSEAGGHGAKRGTLSFVAEVADVLARKSPTTLLLAAGGIGDGRGIAASLMLGADGVLIGSRYWASAEALVSENFQRAALNATGDDTLRTDVPDIARGLKWPDGFDIRVLNNDLMREYGDPEQPLSDDARQDIKQRYMAAGQSGNASDGGIVVGEVAGILADLPGARSLTQRMGEQCEALLAAKNGWIKS